MLAPALIDFAEGALTDELDDVVVLDAHCGIESSLSRAWIARERERSREEIQRWVRERRGEREREREI